MHKFYNMYKFTSICTSISHKELSTLTFQNQTMSQIAHFWHSASSPGFPGARQIEQLETVQRKKGALRWLSNWSTSQQRKGWETWDCSPEKRLGGRGGKSVNLTHMRKYLKGRHIATEPGSFSEMHSNTVFSWGNWLPVAWRGIPLFG